MDRDRDILQFAYRYKVATDDMLAQRFFELARRNTNVLRVTRKLVERNLLRRVAFDSRDTYLVLTRPGCRAIGVLDRTPRPMTEQSLPSALAIAYYCVRHGVKRLTTAEFIDIYPEMHRTGLNSSRYYVFHDDDGVRLMLGMFLIDRGGTAHRIKSKVRKFVKQREDLKFFMGIIKDGRVQITVLTGLEGQERIVKRYLGGDSYCGVRVRTALVPELGGLLTMK